MMEKNCKENGANYEYINFYLHLKESFALIRCFSILLTRETCNFKIFNTLDTVCVKLRKSGIGVEVQYTPCTS